MAGYGGVWRSLVARPLWERKAPGSNPGTPTMQVHDQAKRLPDQADGAHGRRGSWSSVSTRPLGQNGRPVGPGPARAQGKPGLR